MSLDFRYGKVADPSVLFTQDGSQFNGFCQVVCFSLLALDVGEVTEKSMPEILWRVEVLNALGEFYLVEAKVEGFISRNVTEAEWRSVLGLTTNVGTRSRSQWIAKMGKSKGLKPKDIRALVAA